MIETTAAWAARFAGMIACVKVSSVHLTEECRSSSCITLLSAPTDLSIVEYVCRNVCHPTRFCNSVFRAAGVMWYRMIAWAHKGCLPWECGLAKTQSSRLRYDVCRRHTCKAWARAL